MISDDDFTKMGDPEFLAERRRVREQLEHVPEVSAELAALYQRLNDEFDRRASAAWGAWETVSEHTGNDRHALKGGATARRGGTARRAGGPGG